MTDANPRQIAMDGARVFEEFRLASSEPARIREIGVVGTAYDSVLASEITYVSTPITSGAALYKAMDAAGVTDPAEFKRDRDHFTRTVIVPNLNAADAVAQRMVAFGGAVIAPAAFEARSLGWGQDEYMGLWLDVIERRATRLALVDGWQYSNGGAEEYLQALLMQAGRRDRCNMSIVDAQGEAMRHLQAITLLSGAVEDLIGRGFQPTTLARTLHRCVVLHGMVSTESDYGQLSDRCGRQVFSIGEGYMRAVVGRAEMREGIATIRHVLEEARRLLPRTEVENDSSLLMSSGIVRTHGRQELADATASIRIEEDRSAAN